MIQEINELRLKVGEMDSERLQYEKKLKCTKVSNSQKKRREIKDRKCLQQSSFQISLNKTRAFYIGNAASVVS